ncbi:hypothetical protein CS543_06895 [Porphyromonas gingivalis]|uniref:Adaptor n=1 Tax=Porphyromonas phage phage032a_KCOM2801 TaxID=3154122 RepID=A0AAT9JPL2_9CAUD|nr:hypothetical protein [Porphyromonas gingivalis]ATS10593.1 hypothetical protein CS543_06895 [Porphyromonas gingivalis]
MDIKSLFADIAALRRYAPGISAGISLHDLQGMLLLAEKQVIGIVGMPLMEQLLVAEESTREGQALRSAFANLLLLKTITFESVNKRVTGEKDLYRYEVEAMRREYTDNYFNSMDTILSVVSTDEKYSSNWKKSRWASLLELVRITTCSDFDSLYPIDLSYLFFFRTLPFQREALLEYGYIFDKIESKENEDPEVINYKELTMRATLALAKVVIALALERLDITELPLTIRNLFVEQKSSRGGADPSTSTAAMAARLRSEALVDFSAVSIALEDRSYQSGGGICSTKDDKIVLMP